MGGVSVPNGLKVTLLVASRQGGRGGREAAIQKVTADLAKRGHSVSVVLMGPSVEREWERSLPGLHVGPMPSDWQALKERLWPSLRFATNVLRSQRPDVVMVTEAAGSAMVRGACVLAGMHRPAVVSWLHGDVGSVHHSWALRFCDRHLAISDGIAQQIRDRFGAPIDVVYNPVDLPEDLCPRPAESAGIQFAFIGRLESQKRVDRIIQSLTHIREGNWHLQVVGEGSLRPWLQGMAEQLGVADRITWRGWLNDPWREIGAVSGLLLTSDSEGFPMVLIEAISRGVPLISMDCDFGPREVIREGQNGWLLPRGDTDAFGAFLNDICSGGTALPSRESVRATASVYDTKQVVDSIEHALMKALRLC